MKNVNPNPFTTRPEIEGSFGVVASTANVAYQQFSKAQVCYGPFATDGCAAKYAPRSLFPVSDGRPEKGGQS